MSADRRGTVSLPDVESCRGKYKQKQRDELKAWLSEKPAKLWGTNTIWSLKNTQKVYGSPWLDAALRDPFQHLEGYHLDDIFLAPQQ